jgi:hypothetical protein
VFIGAAASGFACLLAAAVKIMRIRLEYRKDRECLAAPAGGAAAPRP